ncbi:MAG: transposase [Eubacterium sp.]|jgi:transposase|nr:transposase [Eubacterium sp.]MCH3954170.1 transposase [Eubacterium sp.]
MRYVKGIDRNQVMMCTLNSFVDDESDARLIDAFVENLDLEALNITKSKAASEGRPAYDPRSMLKLYIYGAEHGIRSSRKLAEACRLNLEVKWMISGVTPDFRTISDFRKSNISSIKEILLDFNSRIAKAVDFGYVSVDGSKIRANNSKDNNFTSHKLDDRIEWLDAHIDEYLRQLDAYDSLETAEEMEAEGMLSKETIEQKLQDAQARLDRYKRYRQYMEENGLSQLSVTDADAKLMKNKNGFQVSYNVQTAVDSETHLIRDFNMTNKVTDHGLLAPTAADVRSEDAILEVVADRGYENQEDMIKCLEDGIIPHVILADGKDSYELELEYVEAECDPASTKSEELSKCLHAGEIPDAYKGVIESAEVKTVRRKVTDDEEPTDSKSPYGTEEEMMARASEGYFVRDPERNLVYCPAGQILRQKCIKKSGDIRYANKFACRRCPHRNKCYKGKNEWKEIDFNKDTLEKPCRDWLKAEGKEPVAERRASKGVFEKIKVVILKLRPDREKMSQRLCLSEHPFGTIKHSMNAGYFLLNGMEKVTGEFAFSAIAYNLKRSRNLLGFNKMMSLMMI